MKVFNCFPYRLAFSVAVMLMMVQAGTTSVAAEITATVKKRVHPVLIRNDHNALLSLIITADKPFVLLEAVTVSLACTD